MSNYYVTFEVMAGDIGLIIVKKTHIQIDNGDTWTQINREVRKVDPQAKVMDYLLDEEDYEDMMLNDEFF